MNTKKDFWRMMLLAYVLIFSGVIVLFITEGKESTNIYPLISVIVLEIIGLITIGRALKIYRTLEDKAVYPKQLDFLNKLAVKLYSDKKRSNLVMTIAIIIGLILGVLIGFNLE